MSRRSARVQEKQKAAQHDVDTVVSDAESSIVGLKRDRNEAEDQEYDETEEKPLKRARKSHKTSTTAEGVEPVAVKGSRRQRIPEQFRKVRGKLGMLERLAKDVPLDVIFEIFYHLDPVDLLRLSRTSKDLRNILMSKSSEAIWRFARENVEGLPPLPPDLNEPQYAHLAFESYCHVCQRKGRCENIYWSFRKRCCHGCIRSAVTTCSQNLFELRRKLSLSDVDSIIPYERVKTNCQSAHVVNYPNTTDGPPTVAKRRSLLVTDPSIDNKLVAEFEALQTDEDRAEWISRKKKERREIEEHARLCRHWHSSRLQNRTDELEDLRSERKQAILARLEEIGWLAEAEIIMKSASYPGRNAFSDHKLVKQSKKLTDHGWKNIKSELVEFLSSKKRERLAEELRRTVRSRVELVFRQYSQIKSGLDLRNPLPGIGDILTSKIIEDWIWDTPTTEDLTEEVVFSKLSEELPRIIDQWRPTAIQQTLDVMQRSVPTATAADLHLAVCCFKNKALTDLSHDRMSIWDQSYIYSSRGPWSTRNLNFNAPRSQTAEVIVKACSLDPSNATPADVLLKNPLLECVQCVGSDKRFRHLMRWPNVLAHWLGHDQIQVNPVVDNEKVATAEGSRDSSFEKLARCAHCHKSNHIWALSEHLKECHDVPAHELEASTLKITQDHWYWDPDYTLTSLGRPFQCEC
ncbi:hypothetical protein D9757_011336 [Collybiopsis confluens]|uniref:F-box domain-containing protein n=1 Tax=Collybiopsis confluens TaxID=2823264 RepID=A0A8H5LPD7_9AGAR|nr:hypothetical protein D9757_011336 [Collybiopsis confluens]